MVVAPGQLLTASHREAAPYREATHYREAAPHREAAHYREGDPYREERGGAADNEAAAEPVECEVLAHAVRGVDPVLRHLAPHRALLNQLLPQLKDTRKDALGALRRIWDQRRRDSCLCRGRGGGLGGTTT